MQTIERERARVSAPQAPLAVTAGKILELAKQAENLYRSQIPAEQRRLLQTVLSNCTFDAGTLCPTYAKPFDLLVEGNKTGNWLLRLDSVPLAASKASRCATGETGWEAKFAPRIWLLRLDSNQQPSG